MLADQEYVAVPEETYQWYENEDSRSENFSCDGSCKHNLQLAAELGKTLLERNKDLEAQLRQAHQINYDQAKEIDLLAKQLEALRNVSDSRMRVYEEVDRNLHDLEKKNEKVQKDSREDKAKIASLNELVETLEARCEELVNKIETLHQKERQRRSRDSRRTRSVPSLSDADEYRGAFGMYDDFRGLPCGNGGRISGKDMSELRRLKDSLRHARQQLAGEQRKVNDRDSDLADLAQDNEALQARVTKLEQEIKRMAKLESELQAVEMRSERLCSRCGDKLEANRLLKKAEMNVEHDDLEEIPNGEVVRLKNGGSAYGSRESLNTLGLELETPIDEQLVAIFSRMDTAGSPEDVPKRRSWATSPGEEGTGSLLGELEDQYRSLVKKYEALIEAKSKRVTTKDAEVQEKTEASAGGAAKRPNALALKSKEVQTASGPAITPSQLDLKSPFDPTEGRFENGPPEYKRLFKEIFETLRRSIVQEDDQNGGNSSVEQSEAGSKGNI